MLTLLFIAVTVVVSWLAFQNPRLLDRLILWPPAVRRGQVDRLLTHGFIHADWSHLLFNMITLFFFGRLAERVVVGLAGPATFVLFYVSAIVVAILPSYLRHRDDPRYRSLGASGAVSAVLFASILLDPWMLIFIPIPVPAILYGIGYVGWSWWADRNSADGVNHNAHLSGAIYGVLFMLLMDGRVGAHFLARLVSPSF
ncbi:rhomboid family intramembrane serine protease [Lysobacter xinjiangensis]|uniref:Rhomboid family intramembrane serine protease n=1 Tax=Cognatilysobacter xinjiangensis TaxID=546892 RepID=A0ABQ3BXC8_9GAMM|nr:rhomboid family intramembrane serine protease [Lysobacter xinjiangensis]GGZ59811.1 rhomboid family intramembrane serine protease [Lysobacter xinjiangensis]